MKKLYFCGILCLLLIFCYKQEHLLESFSTLSFWKRSGKHQVIKGDQNVTILGHGNTVYMQPEKKTSEVRSDGKKETTTRPNLKTWNLPRQDHVFIGRESLLDELYSKLDSNKNSEPNKPVVVSVFTGLGGVGKTQLALQYIHHTKVPYALKAWFHAESPDQLKQQLIELVKNLGYREENLSIKIALPYFKEWLLKNPGWLIVYDNVSSYEEIQKFLPEYGGDIILTSRQQKWPSGFQILAVNVMNEKDSILLIQSLINRKIKELEITFVKEIVKMLGYLPLAMAQAGAYIHQNQISIKDYLNSYKDHEQELLASNILPIGSNALPVAVTWNISLDAIAKEAEINKQSPLALHLLTVCAYLASERIPRHLLLVWLKTAHPDLNNPELVLSNLLGKLWSYSMIKMEDDGSITVHRLVQSIIRQQHKKTLKNKKNYYPPLTSEWYNTLAKATHNEFSGKTQVFEDELRQKNLLPHLQMLLTHYNHLFQNNTDCDLASIMNDTGSVFFLIGESRIAKTHHENALKILAHNYRKNHAEVALTLNYLGRAYRYLGNAKQAKELHEHALTIKEHYYGKNHIEVASTLDYLGMAYRYLGNTKQAKELHERALTIKEQYYGKDHVEVALTLDYLGRAYRYLGNAKQAKELHERALTIKEQYYGKNHVEVASTLDYLGMAYRYLGNIKQAKELHERALTIKEQYYGKNHVEVASTLDYLGMAYRDLGNAKQAKELHERALTIKEQYYGKNHVEVASTLYYLGRDYRYLGNAKQAKELHERALTIKEQYYGKNHVEVAFIFDQLGSNYKYLGDIQQSKKFYEHALSILEQHFSKNHMEIAYTLDHLGTVYRYLGDAYQAKELHERAFLILEQHFGKNHIEVAFVMDHLGRVYKHLGEAEQAKELHECALQIIEQYYGNNHPETAEILTNLGSVYISLNNTEQGKIQLERSLIIKEIHYGMDHPKVAETLMELGIAYKSLKNPKQAQVHLKRALKIRQDYFGRDHPLTIDVKRAIDVE